MTQQFHSWVDIKKKKKKKKEKINSKRSIHPNVHSSIIYIPKYGSICVHHLLNGQTLGYGGALFSQKEECSLAICSSMDELGED